MKKGDLAAFCPFCKLSMSFTTQDGFVSHIENLHLREIHEKIFIKKVCPRQQKLPNNTSKKSTTKKLLEDEINDDEMPPSPAEVEPEKSINNGVEKDDRVTLKKKTRIKKKRKISSDRQKASKIAVVRGKFLILLKLFCIDIHHIKVINIRMRINFQT